MCLWEYAKKPVRGPVERSEPAGSFAITIIGLSD
jgi:hypothetical protein